MDNGIEGNNKGDDNYETLTNTLFNPSSVFSSVFIKEKLFL